MCGEREGGQGVHGAGRPWALSPAWRRRRRGVWGSGSGTASQDARPGSCSAWGWGPGLLATTPPWGHLRPAVTTTQADPAARLRPTTRRLVWLWQEGPSGTWPEQSVALGVPRGRGATLGGAPVKGGRRQTLPDSGPRGHGQQLDFVPRPGTLLFLRSLICSPNPSGALLCAGWGKQPQAESLPPPPGPDTPTVKQPNTQSTRCGARERPECWAGRLPPQAVGRDRGGHLGSHLPGRGFGAYKGPSGSEAGLLEGGLGGGSQQGLSPPHQPAPPWLPAASGESPGPPTPPHWWARGPQLYELSPSQELHLLPRQCSVLPSRGHPAPSRLSDRPQAPRAPGLL